MTGYSYGSFQRDMAFTETLAEQGKENKVLYVSSNEEVKSAIQSIEKHMIA